MMLAFLRARTGTGGSSLKWIIALMTGLLSACGALPSLDVDDGQELRVFAESFEPDGWAAPLRQARPAGVEETWGGPALP